MATGFDTSFNTENMASTIAAGGFSFVGRYLCQANWKRITDAEVAALKAAGLDIVLLYEDEPTSDAYFQIRRGSKDVSLAMRQATSLGAVNVTAIYFTVNYDATQATIDGAITACFTEMATVRQAPWRTLMARSLASTAQAGPVRRSTAAIWPNTPGARSPPAGVAMTTLRINGTHARPLNRHLLPVR